MNKYIRLFAFAILSGTLIFTNLGNVFASENSASSENEEEVYYNCGCGCRHKTIEECMECPCCKGKDIYRNGKLFKKVGSSDNNASSDQIENNTQSKIENKAESNGMNKAKDNKKNTDNKKIKKKKDIYNCGCTCTHLTIEECRACPCCRGKDIYKNGKLFKKAKKIQKNTKPAEREIIKEKIIEKKIEQKKAVDEKLGNKSIKKQETEENQSETVNEKNTEQKNVGQKSEENKDKKGSKSAASEETEKIKIYNCGCGCMHRTMEEFNACPCCRGKKVKISYVDASLLKQGTNTDKGKTDKKEETVKGEENAGTAYANIVIKDDEYVNCGCGCRHKSMEEFNACPCCRGKVPQIHKENENEFNYVYIIYFLAGATTVGVIWAVKEELCRQKA